MRSPENFGSSCTSAKIKLHISAARLSLNIGSQPDPLNSIPERSIAIICTPDHRKIFRRHHRRRTDQQRGEQAIEHLECHRVVWHLAANEKARQPVSLVVSQTNGVGWVVLLGKALLSLALGLPRGTHLSPPLNPRYCFDWILDRSHSCLFKHASIRRVSRRPVKLLKLFGMLPFGMMFIDDF